MVVSIWCNGATTRSCWWQFRVGYTEIVYLDIQPLTIEGSTPNKKIACPYCERSIHPDINLGVHIANRFRLVEKVSLA